MACSKMVSNRTSLEEENKKFREILYKGKFDSWVFETLYNGGEIEVCGLDGLCYDINVNHKTTISDVKKKLRELIRIPDELKFRLCFGGSRGSAILEDHRTLFHYRIPSEATIHMIMESKKERHKIISQNMSTEKEIFDDEYYNEYYEKILKEREERRLRVSSVERKGWTGIPPTENKKIKNESSI